MNTMFRSNEHSVFILIVFSTVPLPADKHTEYLQSKRLTPV